MLGTPPAEFEIDTLLVLRLLAAQHPDLQHLSLQFIDAGWDNAMFRLGDCLAVRRLGNFIWNCAAGFRAGR